MESIMSNKASAIAALHEMIHERLFGAGLWLARGEAYLALHRRLNDLGLLEADPDRPGEVRPTPLGVEMNVWVLTVLLGLWEDAEIPMMLEDYGLMSEAEVNEVSEIFIATAWQHANIIRAEDKSNDSETLLLPYVRRAFLDYFKVKATVN
jgi:hypothetical protein